MTEFILKISLGNDAMNSAVDIRSALEHVARSIRYDDTLEDLTARIKDRNGNTCGKYEVI